MTEYQWVTSMYGTLTSLVGFDECMPFSIATFLYMTTYFDDKLIIQLTKIIWCSFNGYKNNYRYHPADK